MRVLLVAMANTAQVTLWKVFAAWMANDLQRKQFECFFYSVTRTVTGLFVTCSWTFFKKTAPNPEAISVSRRPLDYLRTVLLSGRVKLLASGVDDDTSDPVSNNPDPQCLRPAMAFDATTKHQKVYTQR